MPEIIKKPLYLFCIVLSKTMKPFRLFALSPCPVRGFSLALICLLTLGSAFSQATKGLKPAKPANAAVSGVTRAVVVGISDYQNQNITDLQYADKDARLFAEYLLSPDGLGMDSANVTLLLNREATAGNFISALYGVMELSKEGDQIIIYFSGHGDVESTTISQPGFLLCWDAPSRVYMSGGTFGLAYLQEIISTLSLQAKAKVLVITDACRSGKLAGSSIGGSNATASNLSKQFANEMKILSCQPDEYSLEGQSWGKGRGVFSYYLIPGLKGLADNNDDGVVSLLEIERYLEDNVSKSAAPHSQIPMTVGQKSAAVVPCTKDGKKKAGADLGETQLSLSNDRAAGDVVIDDTLVSKKYRMFNQALHAGHLLYPGQGSAWSLYQELKDESSLSKYHGLMRRNLAASLQDEAQQAINRYLAADTEELNRRWLLDTSYRRYPEALDKAISLLGPGHFYYKPLKARSFYFKGLLKRLDGQRSDLNADFAAAVTLQDSCLFYDSTAAFCYNERGFEKFNLGQYDQGLADYQKALQYSPEWPLVWSNMCDLYHEIKNPGMAIKSGLRAIAIDSTFSLAYHNVGNAYLLNGERDKALEYFQNGYKLDSNSSQLNAKLGLLAFGEKKYDEAEAYWLRSLQLKPKEVQVIINLGHNYLAKHDTSSARKYFFKAKAMRPNNLEAHQGIIEYFYYTGDYDMANKYLKEYIVDYPKDGMAYYLIASIEAGRSREAQALTYLEKAMANGMLDFTTIENDTNLSTMVKSDAYRKLKARYSK